MDRNEDQQQDRTSNPALDALLQMQAMLEQLKKEHAQTVAELDLATKRQKEAKAQARHERKSKKSTKDLVDDATGELRYVKVDKDQRKVVHHYHAHYDPRFTRAEPVVEPEENRVVYCYWHKHNHKLSESIYVDLGLTGKHWVCRELARRFGVTEVKIHV